mmetsp:Transcript_441/g.895  ORF Transcript_441/g.895 Transcript_441/m.895 type:complete len:211 (-) Transcript_441:1427-2059(-)
MYGATKQTGRGCPPRPHTEQCQIASIPGRFIVSFWSLASLWAFRQSFSNPSAVSSEISRRSINRWRRLRASFEPILLRDKSFSIPFMEFIPNSSTTSLRALMCPGFNASKGLPSFFTIPKGFSSLVPFLVSGKSTSSSLVPIVSARAVSLREGSLETVAVACPPDPKVAHDKPVRWLFRESSNERIAARTSPRVVGVLEFVSPLRFASSA